MAALERITQMKQQGLTEPQMITLLKQEGFSPKDINDSLAQSQIKSELVTSVSKPQPETENEFTNMRPSIMANQFNQNPPQEKTQIYPQNQYPDYQDNSKNPQNPSQLYKEQSQQYQKQPQIYPQQQFTPQPQQYQQQPSQYQEQLYPPQPQPYQQQQYKQPQAYDQYNSPSQNPEDDGAYEEFTTTPPNYENNSYQSPDYDYSNQYQYSQDTSSNLETMNEVAQQIVEEKNIELKKQISEIRNFKDETTIELSQINLRIERLEKIFYEMQIAVLRKIGEYGENIKNISDEMHTTQDSFSKIINPLTDNINELKSITDSIPEKFNNLQQIQNQKITDNNTISSSSPPDSESNLNQNTNSEQQKTQNQQKKPWKKRTSNFEDF